MHYIKILFAQIPFAMLRGSGPKSPKTQLAALCYPRTTRRRSAKTVQSKGYFFNMYSSAYILRNIFSIRNGAQRV